METATTFASFPIIPVIDERINIPRDTPTEQQQKITTYNELLEEIYQRKTELVTLEGRLSAMKDEIEGDILHLGLKDSGEVGNADKRKSITTAVAAFVPSSRPPSPNKAAPATNAVAETVTNGFTNGTSMAILKGLSGVPKGVKSRGKGKGRQERAKFSGTDFKYKRGGAISFEDDQYDHYEAFRVSADEFEEEEEEQGEHDVVTERGEIPVPISVN